MKTLLIISITLLYFSSTTYASGCGGPSGAEIINLKIITTQKIQKSEYQINAFGPNFIQVKFSNSDTQILISNTYNYYRSNYKIDQGTLYRELVSYEEYDGCESHYYQEASRLRYEFDEVENFSWPVIFEYELSHHPRVRY